MKDRHHDEAMAELYRNDPELAATLLSAVEADGDQAEVAIIYRQMAKAAELASNGRQKKQS
ncbi:transcriptional regulator [Pseudomonas grimontii]|uniref:transcriptional regulator n=1 Tax=Pseudomonas grimontii TaxID=129847 RepID=UPI00387AC707